MASNSQSNTQTVQSTRKVEFATAVSPIVARQPNGLAFQLEQAAKKRLTI